LIDNATFTYVLFYFIENGNLMKKVKLHGTEIWATVIFNKQDREKIFREEHDSCMGGHCGMCKAVDKVREKYY